MVSKKNSETQIFINQNDQSDLKSTDQDVHSLSELNDSHKEVIEQIKRESKVDDIEREIYKSSLKQVVTFLNTTLPPLENEILDKKDSQDKKRAIKKKIERVDQNKELENSYLLKSVTPTREFKDFKKDEERNSRKKRVNSFSERKFNDIKVNKKLRKTNKK